MLASSFTNFWKGWKDKEKGKSSALFPSKNAGLFAKSFSSLLWHTSITRKMNKKRNPQNSDSEDTRPFPRIWTRSSTSLCWILVLKTKVVKDPFFSLKTQLKEAQQRKESVSSHQEMGTSFFHFSPRNDPYAVKWASYIDEKEQTQTIPEMKSKHRSMLHHHTRDTAGVVSGMNVYGENSTAFMVTG